MNSSSWCAHSHTVSVRLASGEKWHHEDIAGFVMEVDRVEVRRQFTDGHLPSVSRGGRVTLIGWSVRSGKPTNTPRQVEYHPWDLLPQAVRDEVEARFSKTHCFTEVAS